MLSLDTSRLERLSSLQTPAMFLALLCGGLVYAGISASGEIAQTPILAFLVSPVFIAAAFLAAVGFAALFVAAVQANRRLFQIASDARRAEREHLMRALGGERFADRWRSNPRVRNRIGQLRQDRNIPLGELAAVLEVSEQNLSLMERGLLWSPSIRSALIIADLFGEPLDDVFWFDDPSSSEEPAS